MDLVAVYTSQFGAALRMLEQALQLGHAHGLWTAPAAVAPFWQVGYHALFYTDLYLCINEDHFQPRPFHHKDMPRLGQLEPGTPVPTLESLTDYVHRLRSEMPGRLKASGFEASIGIPVDNGLR